MKPTLIWAALVAVLMTGCATPRYLVSDTFLGPRGEKTIVVPVAGDKKQGVLYNYILRICDIDTAGVESTCKDTTVIENVILQSVY
jgi:hypothetical protein